MKLVFVPHGPKLAGVNQYPAEVASDPPMTMEGKIKVLSLVPAIQALGPYDCVFSSLMDRACGTMCTIVKALEVRRVICLDELGQMGNLDVNGTVIAYPGHENDGVLTWQDQGLSALERIFFTEARDANRVLIFSHRPILAGLVALAREITDEAGIQAILDDSNLTKKGFAVFEYNSKSLTVVD